MLSFRLCEERMAAVLGSSPSAGHDGQLDKPLAAFLCPFGPRTFEPANKNLIGMDYLFEDFFAILDLQALQGINIQYLFGSENYVMLRWLSQRPEGAALNRKY